MEKVLSASKAGFPCMRNVWYTVNGYQGVSDERTQRIFDVGTCLEPQIKSKLLCARIFTLNSFLLNLKPFGCRLLISVKVIGLNILSAFIQKKHLSSIKMLSLTFFIILIYCKNGK